MNRAPAKCRHCKVAFSEEERAKGMRIHSPCIAGFLNAMADKKMKARLKKEKAEDKVRRERLETIPELIKKAQTAFNAFIRERDREKLCICCDQPLCLDAVGGGYDCGHFRSTGSASHLRFDETNAHAQRKKCNRWGAGRAVDYRMGLVRRLGVVAVEALESSNVPRKWDRDELREIRATYVAKLKQLRKETA